MEKSNTKYRKKNKVCDMLLFGSSVLSPYIFVNNSFIFRKFESSFSDFFRKSHNGL